MRICSSRTREFATHRRRVARPSTSCRSVRKMRCSAPRRFRMVSSDEPRNFDALRLAVSAMLERPARCDCFAILKKGRILRARSRRERYLARSRTNCRRSAAVAPQALRHFGDNAGGVRTRRRDALTGDNALHGTHLAARWIRRSWTPAVVMILIGPFSRSTTLATAG